MKHHLLAAAGFLLGAWALQARDIYVDPARGDDRADGLAVAAGDGHAPVKTIHRGIRMAKPGDTVHLAPAIFHEAAVFYQCMGEAGNPITLDGHGATLEGADPIDAGAWTEAEPGLFRNDQMLPRLDDAMIQRWFFLWEGKMNHMGRTSKGTSAPLKRSEELQPGEWTFVKDDSRGRPGDLQIFGAFYLKLPPGQALAESHIEMPTRSAGVQLSGDNRHLIIRHLTATHVYNDGFNIHGHCEDVVFENIRAVECGDDGISAHETAQFRVDGFVSIGNSTGICDTGASDTSYRRVFIRDCLGHDLFFFDTGRHSVSEAVVLSSSDRALAVSGRPEPELPCSLSLDNVLIRRLGKADEVRIGKNCLLTARRTTMENLSFQATGGEVTMDHCVVRGHPTPEMRIGPDVRWHGAHNFYDLRAWRFDRTELTPQTFPEFQQSTGLEEASVWPAPSSGMTVPAGVGADVTALEAALAAGEGFLLPHRHP